VLSHDPGPAIVLYFPVSHKTQGPFPNPDLYFPEIHEVHNSKSCFEYPATQRQSLVDLAPFSESVFSGQVLSHDPGPAIVLYFPVSHKTHGPFPNPDLYFPEIHNVHDPDPSFEYPGIQRQSLIEVAPSSESVLSGQVLSHKPGPALVLYCPLSHLSQGPFPNSELYFPEIHNVHDSDPSFEYPATQRQSLMDVAPCSESMFNGHASIHNPVPAIVLYLPRSHKTQGPFPNPDLYFPEIHDVHDSDPSFEYPAIQRQSSMDVAPCSEPVFSGHASTHNPVPAIVLYLPLSHKTHAPPF